MLLKNIEPFVRQALTVTLAPGEEHDVVFYTVASSDCRMFYVLEGKGAVVLNGRQHRLFPGSCVLFQPGTEYKWQPDSDTGIRFIAVNFDHTANFSSYKKSFHPVKLTEFSEKDIVERIVFDDAASLNDYIVLEDFRESEDRLRMLVTEFCLRGASERSGYVSALLSSLMKSVIISAVLSCESSKTPRYDKNYKLVKDIIAYIQRNYSDDISNETISEAFHFNHVYINRLFKKYTGSSLHAFAVNFRMSMAAELLKTRDAPITEIAASVGFGNAPYFSKCFKKHMGMTPEEYRENG